MESVVQAPTVAKSSQPTVEDHEMAAFFLSTGTTDAARKHLCTLLRQQAENTHNSEVSEALRRASKYFTLNVNAGRALGMELATFVAQQTKQHGGVWESKIVASADSKPQKKRQKTNDSDKK